MQKQYMHLLDAKVFTQQKHSLDAFCKDSTSFPGISYLKDLKCSLTKHVLYVIFG